MRPKTQKPILYRFFSKIKINQKTKCWEWIGAISQRGYSNFRCSYLKGNLGHRFSYNLIIGKIPDGLCLDHLCRNRKCVNPLHLEPVTHKINSERGFWGKRTHCIRGHKFTKLNCYIRLDNGCRQCKECSRIRDLKRRGAKSSSVLAA